MTEFLSGVASKYEASRLCIIRVRKRGFIDRMFLFGVSFSRQIQFSRYGGLSMRDEYRRVSKVYDLLSSVYSLGGVSRCRRYVLSELMVGDSVCFMGVGKGREAVRALKKGAHVTVIEKSVSMLNQFEKVLGDLDSNERLRLTIYRGDVVDFCQSSEEVYDFVIAHFFLNVFSEEKMPLVLAMMVKCCGDRGVVCVGDFWRDLEASLLVQWLQVLNWNIALFFFQGLAANPKHKIYLYDGLLRDMGYKVFQEKSFKVLGIPMYRSVLARKTRGL